MFLPALEKIIGSKQFVRWMMAALHKAHGWTPTKKSTFPLWHVSNTTCVPVPVEHCSYGPLKITSNLLHFLLKILLIFSPLSFIPISVWLWSAWVHLCDFKFSQVSEQVVKIPVDFFVQYCLSWCIAVIYKNQEAIIFHLHLLVFWLLTPLQCFPLSCTSCKHISVCALYFNIFCCLFDFMDVFVVSIFSPQKICC